MAKVGFVFGKEMTDDEIVDAVLRMGKEYGIRLTDDRDDRKEKANKIEKKVRKWWEK